MSRPFRLFAPVQISEGVTEYKQVGDGVEYEVDGKRFTRLNFWSHHDDVDLLFWTEDEPPTFPNAGTSLPAAAK